MYAAWSVKVAGGAVRSGADEEDDDGQGEGGKYKLHLTVHVFMLTPR